MTWTKLVSVECDGGEFGCLNQPWHLEHNETVAGARATAARHGWQCIDGMDLCPICVYRRATGCTCDCALHHDGEIVPLKYDGNGRDCPKHRGAR